MLTHSPRRDRARVRPLCTLGIVAVVGVVCLLVTIVPSVVGAPSAGAGAAIFADSPTGAASGVTGGGAGPVVAVTTLAPDGPGSLRALSAGDSPRVVRFDVSGTIAIDHPISVGSNVTIDGSGASVEIVGAGFELWQSTNVVIRNLTIRDAVHVDSDAIALRAGSRGVWLDHLDLSGFSDGLIDVTQGSTDVTISWSHLHDHGKGMLLGDASRSANFEPVDISLHHNLIENVGERSPLLRHGRFDISNNVIRSWGYSADSGYAVRVDCGAHARIENNQFVQAANSRAIIAIPAENCDSDAPPAYIATGNQLTDPDALDEMRPELVTHGGSVTVEPLDELLVDRVSRFAGVVVVDPDEGSTSTVAPSSTSAPPSTTSSSTGSTTVPGGDGVANPELVPRTSDSLTLRWSPVPGASLYFWEVSTCDGHRVADSDGGATTKAVRDLSPGCYLGSVRAVVNGVVSQAETTAAYYFQTPAPATSTPTSTTSTSSSSSSTSTPPSTTSSTTTSSTSSTTVPGGDGVANPELVPRTSDSLTLRWSPVPGASLYFWEVSTCDGHRVADSDGGATTKAVRGLSAGCYVGSVRAVVDGVVGDPEHSAWYFGP